ncbi:uncharacterized protein MONOS_1419 [Monocercomonoides exilis]|uniref:uncharacterized protein n=1 Tax=Monocercomonoides exilis TaxID=2049356 RepID=UPI0035593A61|nr:hypothetical protein MONOS_1419 [Monocercomonoides exilis]|eukprot:MONOS_1419.1-p1 / transcript=MONOS_1419.1 / gene=MONOS_1419 / organism=Monocercomonoides_exilis_PA203 / gene_product=unspecified product / transcript_product=unspecified product / location=Mono_scaffold00025:32408-35305(-) / protein_length=966 / sequence_SO=supercontig / SO=protein_coding / is_pseudo=false
MDAANNEADKKEGSNELEKGIFQNILTPNEIQSRNVFEKNAIEKRLRTDGIQKEDFDEGNYKNETKHDVENKKRRKPLGYVESTQKRWRSNNGVEESWIEGCLKMMNSSVLCVDVTIMDRTNNCVIEAEKKSCVEMRGCILSFGEENSPLKLTGCCAILVNVSLTSTIQHLHSIPPLFASEQPEKQFEHFGSISVCSSSFSSFLVSRPPFLSSAFVGSISLSNLNFFNISTIPAKAESHSTCQCGKTTLMNSCSFHSVCDVFDGGIVPSLNNPLNSLTASNTSFVGCCRTRNVEFIGSEEEKKYPGRQNETDDGQNTFIWCEWNGSKTTGTLSSTTDGMSGGGAIWMYNLENGTLNVSFCSFNNCYAHFGGGGIMCNLIKSVTTENNLFNSCAAENSYGGGIVTRNISLCVRINKCEFKNCVGEYNGGGLFLYNIGFSEIESIETENDREGDYLVFECDFISCSVSNNNGGGMCCFNLDPLFKMSNIRFIECSAVSGGGALHFRPERMSGPIDGIYCCFLFFHKCRCTNSIPYGHDIQHIDAFNVFLKSGNPFHECYTTNADDQRVVYMYSSSGAFISQLTEKKEWLKDGVMDIFVGVTGDNTNKWCGMSDENPCKTIGFAVENHTQGFISKIILMEGNHTSETTTIEIGTKKISVIGKGREMSAIGTGELSLARALFRVTTGHLGLMHLGIDHNSSAGSSPSVVVVTGGSGSLSLKNVLITTSISSVNAISSSVFVVPLSQLSMVDVEIKEINISQSLFSEPVLSSSSSSSSALLLTTATSKESSLANITVKNVKLESGDGVVVAKSVVEEETFVVWNSTFEDCECERGSGGGLKIKLESATSKLQMGETASYSGGTTAFSQCSCSEFGGGVMLWLEENSFDFEITTVSFVGCGATLGGKDEFVNGSKMVSGTITTTKLNFSRNVSIYDELMGYDRNEGGMGTFPLNVFFDEFLGAAHVGKDVN